MVYLTTQKLSKAILKTFEMRHRKALHRNEDSSIKASHGGDLLCYFKSIMVLGEDLNSLVSRQGTGELLGTTHRSVRRDHLSTQRAGSVMAWWFG